MKPFRMVHFSDLHEALPMRDVSGFLDKRIVGAVNSLLNRRKVHRRERIAPALERMLKENPDLIVFTGDAVTCGQPSEFELALKDLKVLTDSGIPLIFSPGNHDAYVRNRKCHAAYEEFVRRRASESGKFPEGSGFRAAAVSGVQCGAADESGAVVRVSGSGVAGADRPGVCGKEKAAGGGLSFSVPPDPEGAGERAASSVVRGEGGGGSAYGGKAGSAAVRACSYAVFRSGFQRTGRDVLRIADPFRRVFCHRIPGWEIFPFAIRFSGGMKFAKRA